MSKLSFTKKTALIAAAGFNDGANKGFWRKQWRDRLGKWAEMGRGIDFQVKSNGSVVNGHGVFIGGTDRPGYGRVMVEGQEANGLPSGVYEIASSNGQEYSARISDETLKKQGIELKDNKGNPVGDRLNNDIPNIEDVTISPITEEDRKLSKEAPNPEQAKIIANERRKSPIANLPAGAESRLEKATPEEIADYLNNEGKYSVPNPGGGVLTKHHSSVQNVHEHLQGTDKNADSDPIDQGWNIGHGSSYRTSETYFYRKVGEQRLGAYQDKSGKGTVQLNGEHSTNYYDNWNDLEADLPNFLENDKKASLNEAKAKLKPYDADGSLAKMVDEGANGTDIATALLSNPEYQKDLATVHDSTWADNRTREENAAHSRFDSARSAQFILDRFNAPTEEKKSKEEAIASDLYKAAVSGDQLPTIDSLESKLQDSGKEPDNKFEMDPWLYSNFPGSEIDYNDYVVNPENTDQILKVKEFGPSEMDGAIEILNVIGEDENGNEVTFKLPENRKFKKVVEWQPKQKESSAPTEEAPAKDIAPENAVQVATKDLKPGDKFYNDNGDLMGTVDSTEPAKNPEKTKINYTDENGTSRSLITYSENTHATDRKPEDQAPEQTPAEEPQAPEQAPETTPTPAEEQPAPVQEVAPTEEPAPTPAAEEPTTPAAKNVKPKPRANDTGKLIPRQKLTEEQLVEYRKTKLEGLVDENGAAHFEYDSNGKAYQPKDPNAMLNFLAKVYPNAKFNGQGHLVLMRQVSNENGKKIQWEIRAANSGDKKVIYMFHFKDLNTGQEETLIHKDARDSVQSLLGKTNSPEVLADILTGVQTRSTGNYDSANAKDVLERAHYFTIQGKTKNIRDLVNHYANGFAARYNPKNGTRLEDEVKSLFDSFFAGDKETTRQRMLAVFGRLPIDEASHAEARQALRDMFKERYPKEDARSFGALVSTASSNVRGEQFDSPETRAIPYSSADKVNAVEEGMIVEYENNIGEKSTLRVVKRQQVNSAAPGQSEDMFDYGDYVTVEDMNGVRSSLPTTKLSILKDQKTPLTAYKGRVQGRRLREARGFTYNPTQLRFPDQASIPNKVLLVDDMTPGDTLYGKGGNELGHIVEIVPIVGKDDKTGYGIMYIDGNGDIHKVAIASGEKRGPDIQTSDAKKSEAKPEAPSETPAGKTVKSNLDESDPDFDIESVQFSTDPNTVEKPKSVGLNFNTPSNAIRRPEEQLKLNEEIQAELDQMTAGLATIMGPDWTYDKSSFQAKSYFSDSAFEELVAKAKTEYPDLSEDQIRTLLELQHTKQRGFFSMSKAQIMDQILQEAATFKKADGAVQNLQIDVTKNRDGQVELAITDEEKAKYDQALADIEKFASNAKMGPLFDAQKHNIRIVSGSGKFADLYRSIGKSLTSRNKIANEVLGVNISVPEPGENKKTVSILINNSLLRSGAGPEGFVDPITDTLTHEFGHTVHRTLEDSSFYGGPYAKAFKEYITRYGTSKQEEHFAESFSKYIQTGESTPTFFQFLQSVGLA